VPVIRKATVSGLLKKAIVGLRAIEKWSIFLMISALNPESRLAPGKIKKLSLIFAFTLTL
jgi:hypothetical protein